MTKSESEKIKEVEEVLGKPVFIGFSEETLRIRRNLVVFVFLALSYKLSGATIASFKPLGIEFDDFTSNHINTIFFIVLAYHTLHFLWRSYDTFLEWRIRITGSKVAHITTAKLGSENADYPDDPRQSSLMNWWTTQADLIGSFQEPFTSIKEMTKRLNELAQSEDFGQLPNVQNIIQSTTQLNTTLSRLENKFGRVQNTIESARIPVSLKRFENWFKHFNNSQSWRWLIFEWGGPLILGFVSIWLVWPW